MTTEALSLTPADIAWLKARAPASLVEQMIKDGEFAVVDRIDLNVSRRN